MKKQILYLFSISILLSSCSVFQKNGKNFDDGYYTQTIDGKKQQVYIDVDDETVRIHPIESKQGLAVVDSSRVLLLQQEVSSTDPLPPLAFHKPSFDIDFLTIPLKFRPAQAGVPMQLNTNLNGAAYFGYRRDQYTIKYSSTPLGRSERSIQHFGFSLGAFTGLGNTLISPTNTSNATEQEYDGVVWSKGLAGIFAVNKFTLGLALGYDHLLGSNRAVWIYQNKLWYGLAFGLNLN